MERCISKDWVTEKRQTHQEGLSKTEACGRVDWEEKHVTPCCCTPRVGVHRGGCCYLVVENSNRPLILPHVSVTPELVHVAETSVVIEQNEPMANGGGATSCLSDGQRSWHAGGKGVLGALCWSYIWMASIFYIFFLLDLGHPFQSWLWLCSLQKKMAGREGRCSGMARSIRKLMERLLKEGAWPHGLSFRSINSNFSSEICLGCL